MFDDVPRPLHYFAATNDSLQSAPESPFTGDPTVAIATDDGHRKLSRETANGEERERSVTGEECHDALEAEIGLRYERA